MKSVAAIQAYCLYSLRIIYIVGDLVLNVRLPDWLLIIRIQAFLTSRRFSLCSPPKSAAKGEQGLASNCATTRSLSPELHT